MGKPNTYVQLLNAQKQIVALRYEVERMKGFTLQQMTREEAAYILDPETTREALLPYALDGPMRMAVVEEACRVAVKALREAKNG